ncbi:MAG: hypothetical protein ACKPJJ_06775, partial [Planctomycetaceae bacterium]
MKSSASLSALSLIAAVFCSPNLLFAQQVNAASPVVPDKQAFDGTVAPFLTKYCADGHGAGNNQSGVVVSDISFDLATGRDLELWKSVLR